ncbi:hypothetical protein HK105_205596 [Polyrhizophydium stewartii]|uniref:F-box domain-containing protein n=1 Tax=Polyrhizophydium stewartii TaxID=2732419 RepID=A0ABR4N5W0_9FUNG|nr:hypothetical protein HK105_003999 [Polyrhizophydium stewartii]
MNLTAPATPEDALVRDDAGRSESRLTLAGLPEVPLKRVLALLDPADVARVRGTCRRLAAAGADELLWRRFFERDWPWWYYSVGCENTGGHTDPTPQCSCWLSESQRRGLRVLYSELRVGDLNPPSPEVYREADVAVEPAEAAPSYVGCGNPFHPLPSSFRAAYALVASGMWTGLVDVIDSLVDRQMSAFMALATFDPLTCSLCLSFNCSLMARYRRGEMVLLHTKEFATKLRVRRGMTPADAEAYLDADNAAPHRLIEEVVPVADRLRLRRIPRQLLGRDSREIYASELLAMPQLADGRPAFRMGEEVEIQWGDPISGFGWWRGFVTAMFRRQFPQPVVRSLEPSAVGNGIAGGLPRWHEACVWPFGESDIPNEPFRGTIEGICVSFPQYPANSPWRSVVVSTNGVMMENPPETGGAGLVGGIRRVTCETHSRIWAALFPKHGHIHEIAAQAAAQAPDEDIAESDGEDDDEDDDDDGDDAADIIDDGDGGDDGGHAGVSGAGVSGAGGGAAAAAQ